MDVFHILQVSLISKLMNDQTIIHNNPFIILCILIYGLVKFMPYSMHQYLENNFKQWILAENSESSIIVPYHIKKYACFQ